MLSVAKIILRR